MKLTDFESSLNKKLKRESLRSFKKPKSDEGFVAYSSDISSEEKLGRAVKNDLLPKVTELITEVERIYNSSGGDYYNEKNSLKDKEECLKPLKEIFEALENIDKKLIDYLDYLSKEVQKKRKEQNGKDDEDDKDDKDDDKDEKDDNKSDDKDENEDDDKDEEPEGTNVEVSMEASKPKDVVGLVNKLLKKKDE